MPPANASFDPSKKIPLFFSRHPYRTDVEIQGLLKRSQEAVTSTKPLLQQAAQIASLVENLEEEQWITTYCADSSSTNNGDSIGADGSAAAAAKANGQPVEITTGGFNNTNHLIPWILPRGSYTTDTKPDVESNLVQELLRNRSNRQRLEQPETRGDDKWDRKRAPGERRRRIVRDKDTSAAPSEPPPSGYVVFVGLMTTKLRHDRGPEAEHSQTAVVQEISRMWREELSQKEQEYYSTLSENIRKEYQQQMFEFRATDTYRPSDRYVRLGNGQGPWIHKNPKDRNQLEAEIASYDTVLFPAHPPSKDEEYAERERQSKLRRKQKIKMEQEMRKARKRALEGKEASDEENPPKQQRESSSDASS